MPSFRDALTLLPLALLVACGDPFKSPNQGAGGQGGTSSSDSGGGGRGEGGEGGQGGAPTDCEPGVAKACYDGPPGTEGVGLCVGGTTTCAADGQGFGPCEGQVVPSAETCGNDVDESCDGDVCPDLAWMKTYGNSYAHRVHGVAVDSSNGIYAVGAYRGVVDYGKGPLDAGGENDMFVLKVDASGNTLRASNYGAAGTASAAVDVLTLSDASVVVGGECGGALSFGGASPVFSTQGGGDACIVAASAAGDYKYAAVYGDGAEQTIDGVTSMSNGDLVLGGRYGGNISFAGNVVLGSSGPSAFVARVSQSIGLWALPIATNSVESVLVATLPGDAILVATGLEQNTTVGAFSLSPIGGTDVLLAKLSPDGAVVWAKTFGNDGKQIPTGLATDAFGRIVVVGTNNGTLPLGSANLAASDKQDGFVATFDTDGNVLWAAGLEGIDDQWTSDVALTPEGGVLVSGFFTGTLQIEEQEWSSVGAQDAFIAKFGPDGHLGWVVPFTGPGEERARSLAFDGTGGIVVAGTFESTVDFGLGPRTSAGDTDLFVLRFAPPAP